MKKLSDNTIQQRMIEWRNLKKLHIADRKRIKVLEKENKILKQRIRDLEDKNKDQNTKIEEISFQFEQIKKKLFGGKINFNRISQRQEKKERDLASYQRPIPKRITKTKNHKVSKCFHCQSKLRRKTIRVFFEEDIPLPLEKVVTKHQVEVGYCQSCQKQMSAITIPPKKVVLGENVRKYISILSIANRLSHNQIKDHLEAIFNLRISTGEIGNILTKEADNLRSEYQNLKDLIQKEKKAHYDETPWKVQKEEQGKYAWVMTSTKNDNTVFSLGQSRGGGNIERMGRVDVGITDNYAAYKNAFKDHQLCWAHPQRKFRDLAESLELEGKEKERTIKTYQEFSSLYQKIRKRPEGNISFYLKRKYLKSFHKVTENHNHDPTLLKRIKESLRRDEEKYFTFFKYPDLPIDNNKAERALRPLVIKRKISFGSKTQRGAETTSILASVILSLKWNDPQNWFAKYLKLGT